MLLELPPIQTLHTGNNFLKFSLKAKKSVYSCSKLNFTNKNVTFVLSPASFVKYHVCIFPHSENIPEPTLPVNCVFNLWEMKFCYILRVLLKKRYMNLKTLHYPVCITKIFQAASINWSARLHPRCWYVQPTLIVLTNQWTGINLNNQSQADIPPAASFRLIQFNHGPPPSTGCCRAE